MAKARDSAAACDAAFETLCAHYADERQRDLGAAAPALYQNSTFTHPDCASFSTRESPGAEGYDYTRTSNPTTDVLERKIAALELTEAALAFGSGMAAISAATLSCVRSGDHLITINSVYGPSRRLFEEYFPRLGIACDFVRGTAVDEFRAATRPNTRLIYLESPTSLVFELQDLAGVAALARERGIATICDNSNATPYFQNPTAQGIDLVVHTATKYLGGHSDLVAGIVAGPSERIEQIRRMERELLGGILDPFAAWLALRGVRTLPVRMDRHAASATAIAEFLEADPRVKRVFYPGVASHPQRDLARRQMRGQSGMLSLQLAAGGRDAAFAVVDSLTFYCIAVSWGGYESLAIPLEVPNPETGEPIWIIRLSVGLENVDDLMRDLDRALG